MTVYSTKCTYILVGRNKEGVSNTLKGRNLPKEIRKEYYSVIQKSIDKMENVRLERTDKGFDLFVEIDDLDPRELTGKLHDIMDTLCYDMCENPLLTYDETVYTNWRGKEITETEYNGLWVYYGTSVEECTYSYSFYYDKNAWKFEKNLFYNIKGAK